MKRMKFKIQMDNLKAFLRRNMLVVGIAIFIFFLGIILLPIAFAQPVKSVEIISDSADYEKKDPGAWKVDKSAKWIGRGEAEITFDVDTIMKTNNKYTDVLFVLDVSSSMDGDKLNRVKSDSIELIESLLSNGENKAGLITFDSTSDIVIDFTKDEELLVENINSLTTTGCTNYYQALVNVDKVLKNYNKEKDRECIVLFLTDGYPNQDTPNEETQYSYLRQQYPYVAINGIQYEMGTNVLDPVKKVTDNQFIADMDTLNNVLFEASVTPITYDNFEINDYIDTNYFYVEDEKSIKVSLGIVNFDKDNQKVTWNMDNIRSGTKTKMTIKVKLKEELIGKGGHYPTNIKEEVKEVEEKEENVTSNDTPILSDNYKVIYDGNAPKGCIVSGIPEEKVYSVFDTVMISEMVPKCDGYLFKGWKVTTKGVKTINEEYFTMLEEDVIIRAEWSKLSISKSMNGEVYVAPPPVIQKLESYSYNEKLWKYKSSITKIVLENKISIPDNAVEFWDISESEAEVVMAYIVPNENDSSKYTAYIQGNEKIIANSDSSYLFNDFSSLQEIENLEYLDTSNVTNMRSMFGGCSSLTSLDVSNFDTSKVTIMSEMFNDCSSLTSLDLSSFDTSNVTNMTYMFYNCSSLTSLDLSSFDTSNVTDMSYMFYKCSSLTSLDVSSFDTPKLENINYMFQNCTSLVSLNLSNFDTSNVTNMGFMFQNCTNLVSLDVSNFNTLNVTGMSCMFQNCSSLTSLDLSSFNTPKLENINYMFHNCYNLTSLDVSNFDTSNVWQMYDVFSSCSSLIRLDLSNFNTSKFYDLSGMFYGCSSLTYLDISNFDTSHVTDMSGMFDGCSSLVSLDLSSFDTSKVTDMSKMFYGCSSLINLDSSSFDTSNVTGVNSMFYGCSKLNTEFTILNAKLWNNYFDLFNGAATSPGAQIIVNYNSDSADAIDRYIATKSENSNVVKGELVTIGT